MKKAHYQKTTKETFCSNIVPKLPRKMEKRLFGYPSEDMREIRKIGPPVPTKI